MGQTLCVNLQSEVVLKNSLIFGVIYQIVCLNSKKGEPEKEELFEEIKIGVKRGSLDMKFKTCP